MLARKRLHQHVHRVTKVPTSPMLIRKTASPVVVLHTQQLVPEHSNKPNVVSYICYVDRYIRLHSIFVLLLCFEYRRCTNFHIKQKNDGSLFSHQYAECAVGYYGTYNKCAACPKETYQDTANQASCKQCENDKVTTAEASKAASACSKLTLALFTHQNFHICR